MVTLSCFDVRPPPLQVFDVLTDFFDHHTPSVVMAALEVYIRRAYVAYEITGISHQQTPNRCMVIQFGFHLPAADGPTGRRSPAKRGSRPSGGGGGGFTLGGWNDEERGPGHSRSSSSGSDTMASAEATPSTSPSGSGSEAGGSYTSGMEPSLSRSSLGGLGSIVSIGDLQAYERTAASAGRKPLKAPSARLGVMAAFASMEQMEASFGWLLSLLDVEESCASEAAEMQAVHVLNVAVRMEESDDEVLLERFSRFMDGCKDSLYPLQVRRVTFLVTRSGHFPKYFTFPQKEGYKEDTILRHIDPAMAFKLEISRLDRYDISRVPCRTPHLHV